MPALHGLAHPEGLGSDSKSKEKVKGGEVGAAFEGEKESSGEVVMGSTMKESKVLLPFRFPGGKYYAKKILQPFWGAVRHDEFREPFVGGAVVFFSKPLVKFNWLNDIDQELMTTYKVLANLKLREELVKLVSKEVASKERWHQIMEIEPQSDLERAFKYYYLNRTSFSGKLSSAAWGYRPKRSLPPDRWHERIIPCGKKLENVKLTCLDFSEVITAPKHGDQVLMYVDPPYFSPPKRKHYRNGFERNDHYRLCELLKSTEHKFFLTYDDVYEVREMYGWANIYNVKFFYRVDNSQLYNGRRRKGFELVITNYKMKQANLHEFA